jgi:SAM-dependent methyltransferase
MMRLKKSILNFYKELIFIFKKKINLDLKKLDLTSLNELFNYFGTDKGSAVNNPYSKDTDNTSKLVGHGYAKFYELHFNYFKNKEIKLLEIGTWKGASIASFYYYFNKAVIFCLDRNYKFQFRSNRINFCYCDTRNNDDIKNFEDLLINKKSELFDIIIDDGSHIYSDILNNFENFFKKVKPGGFYVIEDFNHYKYYPHLNDSPASSPGIEDIFQILKNKKKMQSILLSKDFQDYCFNNISEISIHKGAQQDSYIAFIKKV